MEMNEIIDFVKRAPAPYVFNGSRIIDMGHVRQKWLSEIFSGDIDVRINRRAGLIKERLFFKTNPIFASVRRHQRNVFRKMGIRFPF